MTRHNGKQNKLKPHLIECIDRLRKFIDLDAPSVIIGNAAFAVFATTLATYGSSAGSSLISHIRDQNLHARGVCGEEDCTNYVQRPDTGMCDPCCKTLGIDPATTIEALIGDHGNESPV